MSLDSILVGGQPANFVAIQFRLSSRGTPSLPHFAKMRWRANYTGQRRANMKVLLRWGKSVLRKGAGTARNAAPCEILARANCGVLPQCECRLDFTTPSLQSGSPTRARQARRFLTPLKRIGLRKSSSALAVSPWSMDAQRRRQRIAESETRVCVDAAGGFGEVGMAASARCRTYFAQSNLPACSVPLYAVNPVYKHRENSELRECLKTQGKTVAWWVGPCVSGSVRAATLRDRSQNLKNGNALLCRTKVGDANVI